MHIVRFAVPDSPRAHVGVLNGAVITELDAAGSLAELLRLPVRELRERLSGASGPAWQLPHVSLLPPVDASTEVWACGVTYQISQDARMEESERSASVYEQVYDADRPEIFFKSVAWRVVGDGEPVAIRADSEIDVPEPELAVVVNAHGDVVGFTCCNDVSSRTIEGENPLYLPQAKAYLGACAVGPGIRPAWEVSDPYDLTVSMTIHRDDVAVWEGSANTAQLHRRIDELVGYLHRSDIFPDGVVLSTGTCLVPPAPFTLEPADTVRITVGEVGTLTNNVVRGVDEMTWLAAARTDVRRATSGERTTVTGTEAHVGDTSAAQLDRMIASAHDVAGAFGAMRPRERAGLLTRIAEALDAEHDTLVPLADEETRLGPARLTGELARTTGQLRLFAEVLADGSYLEATIDHADPNLPPSGRPDVRRMLVPLGPALVFAASNFPFAFSVAGGDTASALAAGCPVVVKTHPGHPRLSVAVHDVAQRALRSAGAPDGVLSVVHGLNTGRAAVTDGRIRVGAFTGSILAGRALFDLANSRPDPMPFYSEMGSLNPVVATPAAVQARGGDIARGYVASFSMGMGQFCTKPGLVFLPRDHGLHDALASALQTVAPGPLLNDRIAEGFRAEADRLAKHPAVRVVDSIRPESSALPDVLLLSTTTRDLAAHGADLLTECFGPCSIIVEYDDVSELPEALAGIPGSLTATVHGEDGDAEVVRPLIDRVTDLAGRVIWNGWPTGVAVTWSMQHGGPYPSTTSPLHTSVGATAIRRFLRPVCYQNLPQQLMPLALHDTNPLGIPRRVDGVLETRPTPEP